MFYLMCRELRPGDTAYRWQPIYCCPEKWPLELMLRHLNPTRYKIAKRTPVPPADERSQHEKESQ